MNNNRAAVIRFDTTSWSVVLRAGELQSDVQRQAFGVLYSVYWYPLYAFARRRGGSDHDAMDLTQGFFTHLLKGTALGQASADRGRFRTFLLTSFKNYSANQQRASATLRRGGGAVIHSLDADQFDQRYHREPAYEESPERLFHRSWATTLLSLVKARLAEDYRRAEKSTLFELLEPHLTHSSQSIPRSQIAQSLGLSSAAVNMSLFRMRRRYGELLREAITETVEDAEAVEDEINVLMSAISSSTKTRTSQRRHDSGYDPEN